MRTEEDEAFDDLAKKQGDWGGGFPAKRQMAMDKINAEFREEYIKYRTAFPKEYTAPQPAQEPEREALKLALITLEGWDNHDKWVWPETALEQVKRNTKEAITAIKEALAQEQDRECKYCTDGCPACDARKLPAQREWVGLTDDEVAQAMYKADAIFTGPMQFNFAHAIEQALKEKNT